MRLVILTKNGIPIERNIVREIVRRAAEGKTDLVTALDELEHEMDEYAKSLLKDPAYGGEVAG